MPHGQIIITLSHAMALPFRGLAQARHEAL
jgi:hypothetical protein